MKVHKFRMSRNFFLLLHKWFFEPRTWIEWQLIFYEPCMWHENLLLLLFCAQATTKPWKTKLHPICSTKLAKKSCWEHWISCSLWILFSNLNRNNQFTRYAFIRYAKHSITYLIHSSISKFILFGYP